MKYLLIWIKYLIVMLVISGILIYIFPYKITVLIGIFIILCSFSAATQEIREKEDKKDKE